MEVKELSKEDKALYEAIKAKDLAKVKEALKSANIKANDMFDGTPLHVAARAGDPAVMKFLCDAGANLEAKDGAGMTPATLAAVEGNEEATFALLDKGAKITNDLAMSIDKRVSILEENAQRGMIKPEGLAKWQAFRKKLQEYSRR